METWQPSNNKLGSLKLQTSSQPHGHEVEHLFVSWCHMLFIMMIGHGCLRSSAGIQPYLQTTESQFADTTCSVAL
jgi:hypothetical protein